MILVTGANGQIGVDLVKALCGHHGHEGILATDLTHPDSGLPEKVAFETFDVRRSERLNELLDAYAIDTVYHLAGILSARGEQNPDLCWDVNVGGLLNVLEAGRERGFRIFWPSSIAVFGPETPRDEAPQTSVTDPRTMYGITKTTGEQLCRYHAERHGLDVRSLRFPGVISYAAPPGGGTTDFAVDMFISAVLEREYTCFVSGETRLPMMYMPDAVKAVIDLMQAPSESISIRTSYNLTAFSFSAEELARRIRERVPSFSFRFEPDYRQKIADSWPRSIDDSAARDDWQWNPAFDLERMVDDMLDHISEIAPRVEDPARR